jgi:transposase
MSLLKLSLSERRALARQIHGTKDVKILKRAQALLWLSEGTSAHNIAKRLGISRRTVYYWVSFYHNRRSKSLRSRLQDHPKPGRPPEKSLLIRRELIGLLKESPRQYGYRYAEWTAPLLGKVLQRERTFTVSPKTIRRCLQQLQYVWKRPGYALARQSVTWAQAKGGSRKASAIAQDWLFSLWMKPL